MCECSVGDTLIDEAKFNTLYEHLIDAKEEAMSRVILLPINVLMDLGMKLENERLPIVMSKAVFLRWNVNNILDPFTTMSKLMVRELQDSDHYLLKTLEQIEFLSQEYAAEIIKICKNIGL
jgi:hypothetical protein